MQFARDLRVGHSFSYTAEDVGFAVSKTCRSLPRQVQGFVFAVFNNLLYAVWKGIEGDQGIWWSSFDGTIWAPQQQVPGVGTSPDL